jgi:hypothetical protein
MAGNWIRSFIHSFCVLCFWGLLLGPARLPKDLGRIALIAGIWTSVNVIALRWSVASSPQRPGLSAWLLTVSTGLLTALALWEPARLSLWHVLGGVYRSGPTWAVAAAGCAILAGVAWRQVIISSQRSNWADTA